MQLQFNTFGNEKQKDVCRLWQDNDVTDIVYGGSKGSGKSYLGCSLIFGDAFTYPETHYFIARDSLTNIRKFTIPSIHEVFEHWGIGQQYYDYNGQDNYYTCYNKSRVYLLDAKYLPRDPLYARFGSMQMTRGWIEEAGEFKEAAKNNLSASIGRWKNDVYGLTPKLLQTCNPAKNYLYKQYYRKAKDRELEAWKRFVQALPQDNKRLPAGYLENLHRTLSVNEKQRLLFGNWEYDDDPSALIDYDKILDLWQNEHIGGGRKFITCDVARYGRDTTKICVWDGWRVIAYRTIKGASVPEVAAAVRVMMTEYSVPASQVVVDDDGVGGGVTDTVGCKGFVNNARPMEERTPDGKQTPNYNNLKSQCYFRLADRINQAGIYILPNVMSEKEVEDTVEELEQVKQRDMDAEGKKAVISKEDVKELIGRSPDNSDVLMMREYFELNSPVVSTARAYRPQVRQRRL
ncbi:terminase large subunit domain-containing protein [Spirosoma sp. KUDC1026]|uniref:terminase large subunit domain-containing protein n=1 Tax=Spirosoma sp. KUDC1026 TaxID=2745947 RepID=UPI00159BBB21|nr:terminase family protein [Spirosoma sp. KUDC1026]QKZ15195.1 terminase [Spirosoma sp. KUDC1026]